ncbi:MAG: hypothetical protein JSV52_05855 [Candidatus Zixiibacteriota bacterium]|nr:MAG: hypothetical protein JSV52_05855 [candidate division Zixibacteria bacterium]
MKRFLFLVVLGATIIAWVSCSNPLESGGPDPQPRDTVWDTCWDTCWDTIYVPETIYDTVWDTVYDTVWDTVYDTIYDTIYIYEPYSICSYLQYNINELVWIFGNPAGTYDLHFDVTVHRECNGHELIIDIDGHDTYYLPILTSTTRTIRVDLAEGATIRIWPNVPMHMGDEVKVCLGLEKL